MYINNDWVKLVILQGGGFGFLYSIYQLFFRFLFYPQDSVSANADDAAEWDQELSVVFRFLLEHLKNTLRINSRWF